jgi:hypothetical protein
MEERQLNQSADLLPRQATSASHVRYRIAQALAALCPPVLGQEVAVTGSVSKGLADDTSDIEQVFYVQNLPDIQRRDTWLHQIGAKEILHDEAPIEGGSIWSTFHFRDVWVEATLLFMCSYTLAQTIVPIPMLLRPAYTR